LFGESSRVDFYRHFYITDLWKDNNEANRLYWLSKLKIELQRVRTHCVIFVGTEAGRNGRPLLRDRVPNYEIPFPRQSMSNEEYKGYIEILGKELRRRDVASTADIKTLPSRYANSTSGGDRNALWREVFFTATPLKAAEVLAAHPDAAARTARLVAEPTAGRVVAIANAMYNPCRPKHLAATGRAASEEAWGILLSRRDTAYIRSGTQWERLVRALDPIPDWAADRLRNMDILALGSMAQALIRGPYRRA
jgi:hypothetical protein